MKTIALLGCGGNAGMNFVKSLKMKDQKINIVGFDLDRFNLLSSNSDTKILMSKMEDLEKVDFLNDHIQKLNIDFIHAQPDLEVKFLCEFGHLLKCSVFPHSLSEWDVFANKHFCSINWGEKLDLSFKSFSLIEVTRDPSKWDFLFEPSGKVWCRSITGAGSKAALPITSLEQAKSWANYWVESRGMAMEDFMLSEYLPGREFAVQTFWLDGEIIHSQARERLVYFFGNIMPSGQSSTPAVAMTISEDRVYEIAEQSIKCLVDKPNGIYCVDLKENSLGEIIPMEVNYGRFFTTSDFFSNLGMNSPFSYVNCLRDKKINSLPEKIYWIRGLDREPFLYLGDFK